MVAVTYVLKIGPTHTAILPMTAQVKIIQTRAFMLNTSSMLPATTMVGMADNIPVSKRTMITTGREGTAAVRTEKIQYPSVDRMYRILRPKTSEYGGKKIPPMPWPIRYLQSQGKERVSHVVLVSLPTRTGGRDTPPRT